MRHACSASFCMIRRLVSCSSSGQLGHERSGFARPAGANFHGQHHQPWPATWARGKCVLCAFSQYHAGTHHSGERKRGSCPPPTGTSPKQWKALNRDLQSAAVRHIRRCQVHVLNQHIFRHASASFAARARGSTLQRKSTLHQKPRTEHMMRAGGETSRLDGMCKMRGKGRRRCRSRVTRHR